MWRILSAVVFVVACATVAAADSFEDADSAIQRGDYTWAARLFRSLAEQGNAPAQFNLGGMYAKGQGVPQDYQEALKWLRKAADQGDAGGQYNLGVMYEKGQGVPQDFVRAHLWLNIAAASSKGDLGKSVMEYRDIVASQMTAMQIGKAQEMARRCQETKFKECD